MLSRSGHIYCFGNNRCGQLGIITTELKQTVAIKLEIPNKFIDIASHSHYNISIAVSVNNIYISIQI